MPLILRETTKSNRKMKQRLLWIIAYKTIYLKWNRKIEKQPRTKKNKKNKKQKKKEEIS